jgi:hypothetical protein
MKLYAGDVELQPHDLGRQSGEGYWYLGSPYSKYPDGLEAAFREICRIAGWCIENGVNVYSPIAHTHPIAIHSGMDPLSHEIWLPADRPLMDGAHGLIIVEMETWEISYGLKHEMDVFRKAGKPVVRLVPDVALKAAA